MNKRQAKKQRNKLWYLQGNSYQEERHICRKEQQTNIANMRREEPRQSYPKRTRYHYFIREWIKHYHINHYHIKKTKEI